MNWMGLNRIFECGYDGIHNQQYLRIDVFENEDLTFISPEPVDFGGYTSQNLRVCCNDNAKRADGLMIYRTYKWYPLVI